MSKAILVIDMTASCYECRLFNEIYDNDYGWVNYCGADFHTIRNKNERYFCPLKPMPEKRENIEGFDDIDFEWAADSYCEGWNDCIDEILGEME